MKHNASLSGDPPHSGSPSTSASVEPELPAHSPGRGLGSAAGRQPLASSLPQASQSVQEQPRGSDARGLEPHCGAQLYQTLRAVVRLTSSSPAPDLLLPQICQILTLHSGFDVARVLRRTGQVLSLAAYAGRPLGGDVARSADAADPDAPPALADHVWRSGQPCMVSELPAGPGAAAWAEPLRGIGLCSGIALPLWSGSALHAVLEVYCSDPTALDSEGQDLLRTVAQSVSTCLAQHDCAARRGVAEEALRSSEQRLKLLIEQAPAALAMFDLSMRYLHVSRRWLADYRIQTEEVIGRSHYDVFPDLPAHLREVHQRALRGEAQQAEAERFERADGTVHWVRWQVWPWYDTSGLVGGILINTEDISERMKVEDGLRLRSAALAAATDGIVITDPRGVIEWLNPAFSTLSGYAPGEVVGKTFGQLVRSGEQPESFYTKLWSTIRQGLPWQGELINRRKDGSQYHEHMSITAVRNAAGRITHYIAIKQDISEKQRMEAMLLRTQRLESIGRLAGGIAHDLNNLLTPMLMAPAVLRMFITDSRAMASLDSIETSAQRGASIIRQLLTFSRGLPGDKAPVQLRTLLQDMAKIIHEAFPKNISLRTRASRDVPTTLGDATQLHQVLMNLCVNARDAMPDGGTLTLSLDCVNVEEPKAQANRVSPGPYVVLGARDTGIGIPPENLERIFDPFFTTKQVGEGTGLGLSTTLGIVRAHQGFIEVESAPGQGARFSIYLPADGPAVPAQSEGALADLPQGHGELVLVVDDEELAGRVTCQMLELCGYRTVSASNGREGLRIYHSRRREIQVVVTDLMMPQVDGITLIRTLRAEESDVQKPGIVVMTGYISQPELLDELRQVGYRVISKPFTAEVLLDSVAEAMRTHSHESVKRANNG